MSDHEKEPQPVPFEAFRGAKKTTRKKRGWSREQQAASEANARKARAVLAEKRKGSVPEEAAPRGVSAPRSALAGLAGFVALVLDDPEFKVALRLIGDVIRRHAEG